MKLPPFVHHATPDLRTFDEVMRALDMPVQIVAGGTDLFVLMKQGLASPAHLVSVKNLAECGGITAGDRWLRIGAAATLSEIGRNSDVGRVVPALRDAVTLVATEQIRNVATIGGNLLQSKRCIYYNRSRQWRETAGPCYRTGGSLCHAVPGGVRCRAIYQGDSAPVLEVLGAQARFVENGAAGEMTVGELVNARCKETLATDGSFLLTEVLVPLPGPTTVSGYRKFRRRGGMDYPEAGVACSVTFSAGVVEAMRICLTGVAAGPLSVPSVERIAVGRILDRDVMEEVGAAVRSAVHPADTTNERPKRRRAMVATMTKDLLRDMVKGIEG